MMREMFSFRLLKMRSCDTFAKTGQIATAKVTHETKYYAKIMTEVSEKKKKTIFQWEVVSVAY